MELITPDYWKQIMYGVLMMIASTILASLQTSTVKWGSDIGYTSAVIVILRGIMQCILCIAESVISPKLHLIKDIKAIGVVPKRTIIPIFNERDPKHTSLQSINYGTFEATTSYSQLTGVPVSTTPTPAPQQQPQTNYKTFYILIWSAVILRGVFGGIGTLLIFKSAALLPIGDVQALSALSAIFTPFLAYFCFKDKLTVLHLVSLIGALIGVIFIVQPLFIFHSIETNESKSSIAGYVYIVSGAFAQSLIYICIQFARKVPVYILIISQSIWSVITGFIVLFFLYDVREFKRLEWIDSYLDVAYVLVLGFIGYLVLWLLTKSGQYISSGVIALLSNLSIVWGYLLQWLIFKNVPSWLTILGALCMFSAAVVVSVDKIGDARRKSMSVIQRNITTNPVNV